MNKHFHILTACLACSLVSILTSAQQHDAEFYKNEGIAYDAKQFYHSALKSYTQAIEMWGDSALEAPVAFAAAECAMKLREYGQAIALFSLCKEHSHRVGEADYQIAQSYKESGVDSAYIAALEDGCRVYTSGHIAYLFRKDLAMLYRNCAYQLFKEAEADGGMSEALSKAGEALDILKKAKELSPDDRNTLALLQKVEQFVAELKKK